MEKVKISGPIHPKLYHYEWKLTEVEREHLRDILAGIEAHCVKDFIAHFEHLCQCVLTVSEKNDGVYKRPSKELRRVRISDAIKTLEKALKETKKIARYEIQAIQLYDLNDLFGEKIEQYGECLEKTHGLALNINREMESLIQIFKSSSDFLPKKGNKTTRESFGVALADAYMEHIGRPTDSQKGRFIDIVESAFELVGLPSKDASKIAKAVCPAKPGRKPPKKVP